MSLRYFLRPDGVIFTPPERHNYERHGMAGFTEVRVVPLDSVVIDRSELPEVEHDVDGTFARVADRQGTFGPPVRMPSNPTEHTADAIYAQGLARLAIAAYLREHPPVDEAQVKALADDIRDATNEERLVADVDREIARHLIAQGWTNGGAA
jgi:hypothetical protein